MKKESMRQQLTITIALILLLAAAVIIKSLYFPVLNGPSAYYFISIFWICGILIAILSVHLIWRLFFERKSPSSGSTYSGWANRRNTFRIIYPAYIRPVLVVEKADHHPLRNLEFPIVDLSQGGSCFLDDGSLGDINTFSGHIRFSSGDRIRIAGQTIRKIGNQVSIQFSHAIAWSILLDEQRRVLAQMKTDR